MPEFILQEYKHPLGIPTQRIIFTKNEYCVRVKMPEWDRLKESEPKDYDAFDPPGGNQFRSTYRSLGHEKEVNHFATTTGLTLEQIKQKEKYFLKPDKKPMIHYLTFKDVCLPREHRRCPVSELCANEYLSTMQESYKFPHPCVLQPLQIPKPPFLENRRLKLEEPRLDENKFFDDCYIEKVRTLQRFNGFRQKSYDPITQKYTDGSSVKSKKRKCVEVPFVHVK